MNIPFSIGTKYKKVEVMKVFKPNVQVAASGGYFSYGEGPDEFFLIFSNVQVSTNIHGKSYDYSNTLSADKRRYTWESRNGDSIAKNLMLSRMYLNPSRILIFIRNKSTDDFEYFGIPKAMIETQRSTTPSVPSKFIFDFDSFADFKKDNTNKLAELYMGLLEGVAPSLATEIGLKGEIFVNKILHGEEKGLEKIEDKLGIKIDINSVKWMYMVNKYADHDFSVESNSRKYYLEIKTTSEKKSKRIFISENEYNLANENSTYYIIVVNDILKNPSIEIYNWNEFNKQFNVRVKKTFLAERK